MREFGLWLIIGVLLFLLTRSACNGRKEIIQERERFNTVVSGLQKQILKDGTELARINALMSKRKDAINLLQMTNDSLAGRLADLIKENGRKTQGAVVADVKTVYVDTGSVVTIIDSIMCKGDTVVMWPTYQSGGHDKWATWAVTAGPDTIINRFTVYNQFALAWKKKKGRIECKIHNANPHTTTVGSKAWVIEQKPVFWMDYGLEASGVASSVENLIGFGLYGELKYRLFTGGISTGIQHTNEGVLSPYGRIEVKAALGRISY